MVSLYLILKDFYSFYISVCNKSSEEDEGHLNSGGEVALSVLLTERLRLKSIQVKMCLILQLNSWRCLKNKSEFWNKNMKCMHIAIIMFFPQDLLKTSYMHISNNFYTKTSDLNLISHEALKYVYITLALKTRLLWDCTEYSSCLSF